VRVFGSFFVSRVGAIGSLPPSNPRRLPPYSFMLGIGFPLPMATLSFLRDESWKALIFIYIKNVANRKGVGGYLSPTAEVVMGGEGMDFENVKKLLQADLLIRLPHALGRRSVDVGRDPLEPPESAVGTPQADNGRRPETQGGLHIVLKDFYHFVIRIRPGGVEHKAGWMFKADLRILFQDGPNFG